MPLLKISEEEWEKAKFFFKNHPDQAKFNKKTHGQNRTFVKLEGVIYAFANKNYYGEEYYGQLGKGAFGKIKVAQTEEGQNYAVKSERKDQDTFSADEKATHLLMKKIKQLHATGIRERLENHKDSKKFKYYKILTLLHGKDLKKHLYETIEHQLNDLTTLQKYIIALKACEAIDALHHDGILHCDIKPENFMLEADGTQIVVHPTDFDFSLEAPEGVLYYERSRGTPAYAAPELFSMIDGKFKYSKASDCYALGKMFELDLKLSNKIWEDMIEDSPEKRSSLSEVKQKIAEILYSNLNDLNSDDAKLVLNYKKERAKKIENIFFESVENALSLEKLIKTLENNKETVKIPPFLDILKKLEKEKLTPDVFEAQFNDWLENKGISKDHLIAKKILLLSKNPIFKKTDEEIFYDALLNLHDNQKDEFIKLISEYSHDILFLEKGKNPIDYEKKDLLKQLENAFKPMHLCRCSKFGMKYPFFNNSLFSHNEILKKTYIRLAKAEHKQAESELKERIKQADSVDSLVEAIEQYPYDIFLKEKLDANSVKRFFNFFMHDEHVLSSIYNDEYEEFDMYGIEEDYGLRDKVIEIMKAQYEKLNFVEQSDSSSLAEETDPQKSSSDISSEASPEHEKNISSDSSPRSKK